jgi:hypothetical protein
LLSPELAAGIRRVSPSSVLGEKVDQSQAQRKISANLQCHATVCSI